jgi:alcohol dehydrogenase class IV
MLSTFNIPSSVIIGAGASMELLSHVQRLHAQRVLLVTDDFMVQSGVAERVVDPLVKAGIHVAIFSGVQPDPTDENVRAGLEQQQAIDAQAIIGLGGGSPMDAAKVIAVMATNAPPISQYAGYHKIGKSGLPLLVIPTTAGTGSEVTKVAVITDTQRDVKMMMLDVNLLPQVALVDYELSMSMPPSLTAHVGVDTLTHAIEAYVSRKANGNTDPIALSCVKLVADHLLTAFRDPDNITARSSMMLAACQGGMAFANSSVCLVHGMSRPIGAHFHVPHGLSNAVLLPEITRFSLKGAPERYATIARTLHAAHSGHGRGVADDRLVEYLINLNHALDISRVADVVRVDQPTYESRLEQMAQSALDSGSPQNNPVAPTKEEIMELYRKVW